MRTPPALERLAEHRILRPFMRRRQWVRQVFVSALAGAAAWQVADIAVPKSGVTAAIAATLTVQVSLHKSVREGFAQILGTSVGAGVALASSQVFGVGSITVLATVAMASVAARALRLGAGTSVNVVITALIVIGPGPSESTAVHRLAAVILGTLIGMAFSWWSHPKNPEGRTIDEITRMATDTAELLAVMSIGVADGYDRERAGRWLARARVLTTRVPRVRAQALEARDYARWFPTADRDTAEDLYRRAFALDHAVDEVATIARALFDAEVHGGLSATINQEIADALASASYAMSATVVELRDADDMPLDPAITEEVRQASADLTGQLLGETEHVEQDRIALGMAIASNIERIADSIDLSSPAIHEVPEPGPPTEELVLKLPKAKKRRR